MIDVLPLCITHAMLMAQYPDGIPDYVNTGMHLHGWVYERVAKGWVRSV